MQASSQEITPNNCQQPTHSRVPTHPTSQLTPQKNLLNKANPTSLHCSCTLQSRIPSAQPRPLNKREQAKGAAEVLEEDRLTLDADMLRCVLCYLRDNRWPSGRLSMQNAECTSLRSSEACRQNSHWDLIVSICVSQVSSKSILPPSCYRRTSTLSTRLSLVASVLNKPRINQ